MVTVPSLTDETPLDQYTATSGQTDFNFTYMIFATSDIKVYVNGTLKTETTDYVVKQSDGSAIVPADDLPMDGGKVVFNSGLTLNDEVSLSRDIPIERTTGYSTAGAFRAEVLNAELTKILSIQQQLERDISRSVRLSAYDAEGGTFTLPEGRASKFLAFDASGNMIASAGSADSFVVSSFMETLLDDTTAAAAQTTLGISAYAQTLLDDTTAAAARTTLAAQQDVITTRGDIIRGSSSNVAERLAIGTANQYLRSDGTDISWVTPTNPTVQKFTSGSGTYTTPAGVKYIRVRMIGGGAGGSGSGAAATSAVDGSAGGNTTFGTSLLVANGGSPGSMPGAGGLGGSASLGTGPIGTVVTGGNGEGYSDVAAAGYYMIGGSGGGSVFGYHAGGTANANATNATANTGRGGGGAGGGSAVGMRSGIGGGAGGYVDAIINSPSATYAYTVGAAGSGGSAGTSGFAGGAGGSGYIEVTEFYH